MRYLIILLGLVMLFISKTAHNRCAQNEATLISNVEAISQSEGLPQGQRFVLVKENHYDSHEDLVPDYFDQEKEEWIYKWETTYVIHTVCCSEASGNVKCTPGQDYHYDVNNYEQCPMHR